MKIAVLTANLGSHEKDVAHALQAVPGASVDSYAFTDANCPPRPNMSARMHARLLKCFGWQLVPGYDRYVWVDGQFQIAQPHAVAWLLAQQGDADFACFTHPDRHSIHEEADWIRERLPRSQRLMVRYAGEWMDEAVAEIDRDPGYADTWFGATGIVAYRNTSRVQDAMKTWWYLISRYTVHDQLVFPYVAWKTGCTVREIPGDIFHDERFVWTRGVHA